MDTPPSFPFRLTQAELPISLPNPTLPDYPRSLFFLVILKEFAGKTIFEGS